LSTLGGIPGIVEYDFVEIIDKAARTGLTRNEIGAAYRAALNHVFDNPGRGRPKGKTKNVQHYVEKVKELLLEGGKRPFTAAKEVLANGQEKPAPTPQHLVRSLKADLKANRDLSLKILPELKSLAERFRRLPSREAAADACENLVTLIERMNEKSR
jgi:hypothetical protein